MRPVHRLEVPSFDSPPLVRYGLPERVNGVSPAAATDFTFAPDGAFFTRLLSVFVRIVTSATAASREVVVSYETAEGNRFAVSGINTTVTANNTADYFFSIFVPEAVATVDSTALVPLSPLLLMPTDVFKIHVNQIQAGDQLSRIRFYQERFYTTNQPPTDVPVSEQV